MPVWPPGIGTLGAFRYLECLSVAEVAKTSATLTTPVLRNPRAVLPVDVFTADLLKSAGMSTSEVSAAATLFAEGCALLEEGKAVLAADVLSRAARLSPEEPAIHEKLGEASFRSGQCLPALRAYDRVIELGAATAHTWRATGDALADVGEYAQAVGAFENSVGLNDDDAEAHHNLARVLYRLGDVDRAAGHLQTSIRLADAPQSWLSLATLIPGAPGADHRRILDVRRTFAEKLAGAVETPAVSRPVRRRTEGGERLRVGYVSAFFHSANYMKPVWALINHHDRDAFEIHLFSDSDPGKGMPGYREHARDRIHATGELTNEELGEQVRQADIDILVDLNAYSTPERLPLFVQSSVPIAVAWFNMYATSGLAGYDYIVGDGEVVRAEEEPFFTEAVRRLPVSYLTFTVDHPVPSVTLPPCARDGILTFGSLVSQYKITPFVIDAWAEILRRASGTRLLLANTVLKSPHNRQYVADLFAARGWGRTAWCSADRRTTWSFFGTTTGSTSRWTRFPTTEAPQPWKPSGRVSRRSLSTGTAGRHGPARPCCGARTWGSSWRRPPRPWWNWL